ncbi:autotransporter outer membrane beta-barrel domain-containing protein [Spirabiliibacterium mucosae]|uniref:autotransporter outer membrane beta-barrel domain-containing protein n=1 Tax=Spirabiliibacterium mucosae TaxID=28156 RepID=UPI001AACC849
MQSAVEPKSDKLIPSVSARDSRFVNAALLGSTLWQLEMNDVNKRLGDLHFAQGNEGLWLRSYGGKYSLDYHIKDRAFTSQNHFAAVQLGYDRTLDAHIRSGLAVSVVKGKAKLNQWAQNAQLVGVTGYTTYTPNEADYIDVVAKVAQLQQKIAGNRLALWGVAFSTEYGHKFTLSEHWFATPNAELTLGYLQGGDVNIEGHHYQQRSNTHWSARAGVNLGYAYNMGNIMLKASVQHEANNRLKLILDNGANDAYQHSIDLSGTQLRLGLGGTHDLGHNTYVYYNIEKSAKGKLHLHWRTDIGLRYSF